MLNVTVDRAVALQKAHCHDSVTESSIVAFGTTAETMCKYGVCVAESFTMEYSEGDSDNPTCIDMKLYAVTDIALSYTVPKAEYWKVVKVGGHVTVLDKTKSKGVARGWELEDYEVLPGGTNFMA